MLKTIVGILIVVLLITTTRGLHAKIERKVTYWLEISRVAYFLLLTTSLVHAFLHFNDHLLANLLWVTYLIIIFTLMEVTFRLKRETFGNPHLSLLLFITLLGALGISLWWI